MCESGCVGGENATPFTSQGGLAEWMFLCVLHSSLRSGGVVNQTKVSNTDSV